LPSDK
jgi:hypothetical protein